MPYGFHRAQLRRLHCCGSLVVHEELPKRRPWRDIMPDAKFRLTRNTLTLCDSRTPARTGKVLLAIKMPSSTIQYCSRELMLVHSPLSRC